MTFCIGLIFMRIWCLIAKFEMYAFIGELVGSYMSILTSLPDNFVFSLWCLILFCVRHLFGN